MKRSGAKESSECKTLEDEIFGIVSVKHEKEEVIINYSPTKMTDGSEGIRVVVMLRTQLESPYSKPVFQQIGRTPLDALKALLKVAKRFYGMRTED